MFKPDFDKTANGSVSKINMLKKDPLGYFVLSMMAGAFIGVGVLLAFTVGGQLDGAVFDDESRVGIQQDGFVDQPESASVRIFTPRDAQRAAALLFQNR